MTDQPPFLLSRLREATRFDYREATLPRSFVLALCDVVEAAQFHAAWMQADGCPYGLCLGRYDDTHHPDCPFPRLIEALSRFTGEQEK